MMEVTTIHAPVTYFVLFTKVYRQERKATLFLVVLPIHCRSLHGTFRRILPVQCKPRIQWKCCGLRVCEQRSHSKWRLLCWRLQKLFYPAWLDCRWRGGCSSSDDFWFSERKLRLSGVLFLWVPSHSKLGTKLNKTHTSKCLWYSETNLMYLHNKFLSIPQSYLSLNVLLSFEKKFIFARMQILKKIGTKISKNKPLCLLACCEAIWWKDRAPIHSFCFDCKHYPFKRHSCFVYFLYFFVELLSHFWIYWTIIRAKN